MDRGRGGAGRDSGGGRRDRRGSGQRAGVGPGLQRERRAAADQPAHLPGRRAAQQRVTATCWTRCARRAPATSPRLAAPRRSATARSPPPSSTTRLREGQPRWAVVAATTGALIRAKGASASAKLADPGLYSVTFDRDVQRLRDPGDDRRPRAPTRSRPGARSAPGAARTTPTSSPSAPPPWTRTAAPVDIDAGQQPALPRDRPLLGREPARGRRQLSRAPSARRARRAGWGARASRSASCRRRPPGVAPSRPPGSWGRGRTRRR